MKFISPKVEWWAQDKTTSQHIARVGRICYKALGKQPTDDLNSEEREAFIEKRDKERCEAFWQSGHRSMLRHGTKYYFVEDSTQFPMWLLHYITINPYVGVHKNKKSIWISTNLHFLRDHENMEAVMRDYEVSEDEYIFNALEYKSIHALMLLRMTLVVTTQRIQGESYNRKSPNCIAEQSTRYVNLDKKGGVQICRPHWEATAKWYQKASSHFGYWVAEKVYQFLLATGLKPEDARGNLTFNTYTVCAYTYNLYEWKHIMDMRLRDLTGKAHPDAHIVAEQISDIINDRMRAYLPNFTI